MIILKVETLAEKLCCSHRHILLCTLKRHQEKKEKRKGRAVKQNDCLVVMFSGYNVNLAPLTEHLRHNETVPQSYTS